LNPAPARFSGRRCRLSFRTPYLFIALGTERRAPLGRTCVHSGKHSLDRISARRGSRAMVNGTSCALIEPRTSVAGTTSATRNGDRYGMSRNDTAGYDISAGKRHFLVSRNLLFANFAEKRKRKESPDTKRPDTKRDHFNHRLATVLSCSGFTIDAWQEIKF